MNELNNRRREGKDITLHEAELMEKEKSLAPLEVELSSTKVLSDLQMQEIKKGIEKEVLAELDARVKDVEEREKAVEDVEERERIIEEREKAIEE